MNIRSRNLLRYIGLDIGGKFGKTPAECANITAETIANLRSSPEEQEGLTAFLEKRKPNSSG